MSGIAGVIYNDGRPATVADLLPVIEKISMLGPDGISTWAEGCATLVHFALHTTPEAAYEQWPLSNAQGDILVADARIDNREELIHILRYQPTSTAPITDAELILAAHERWGDDAPAYLVGDFAYALWNNKPRILRLVRSPFGMKGLYYRITSQGVFFATTLRGVKVLAPHNLSTNLPWVASFLTKELDHLFDQSLFVEINKVPPAHWLRFDIANQTQTGQRFWNLYPNDHYASWSDQEWVEGFRDCFDRVIAASLRSTTPISMLVSGGLDSSSLALVAHRLMHDEQNVPSVPTYVFTNRMKAWPSSDESEYRDAVVARLPHFHSEWIDMELAWTWKLVEYWQQDSSIPINLSNAFALQPTLDRTRHEGGRVIISGVGGDIVTGGEDYGLLEAFYSLPWYNRLRELPHFARGRLRGGLKFAKKLMLDRIPTPALQWRKKRQNIERLYRAECKQIAKQKAPLVHAMKDDTPLQTHMRTVFFTPVYLMPFEQISEVFALQGIEYRCPFYDRRLVEMVFQQPASLRIAKGRARFLLKEALKEDLPAILQTRNSKARFSRFTAHVLEADHARASKLPPDAFTRQQGWIDLPTWEKWAVSPQSSMQTILLHRVAHLENWLSLLGVDISQAGKITSETL